MGVLKTALIAIVLAYPLAATAAEVAVPRHATVHHVYRHHIHVVRHHARAHWGYYFYRWGWRYGGSGRTWFGSTFVFADAG